MPRSAYHLFRKPEPTARRLAADVRPHLHLRTRFLVLRLRLEHGVSASTAMRAVSLARKGAT